MFKRPKWNIFIVLTLIRERFFNWIKKKKPASDDSELLLVFSVSAPVTRLPRFYTVNSFLNWDMIRSIFCPCEVETFNIQIWSCLHFLHWYCWWVSILSRCLLPHSPCSLCHLKIESLYFFILFGCLCLIHKSSLVCLIKNSSLWFSSEEGCGQSGKYVCVQIHCKIIIVYEN